MRFVLQNASVNALTPPLLSGNQFGDLAAKRFGTSTPPPWFSLDECQQLGLAADTLSSFQDDSVPSKAHESLKAYWERTRGALHKVLAHSKGQVIIVAHVLSGAIMREMLTRPSVSVCPGEEVIGNLPGAKVRPTAITCLECDGEGEWIFAGEQTAQFAHFPLRLATLGRARQ